MPNIAAVAALAGVSTATVSRVLNDHPYITEETRSQVLRAMEQLGYRPSRVARRLRLKRTQILGLILSDIANPFFTSVIRGIEDVAYDNGYSLLLCNSDERGDKERLYVEVLEAEQVAGVIMSPVDEDSRSCALLLENGVPVVAIDRRLRQFDLDTVLVNNVKGVNDAISYLIGLGHNRIGFIGGPTTVTTGRERQNGYEQALRERGLEMDASLLKVGNFKQESGYRAARELLDSQDPPTAIFSANNLMTLGALNAINEKGLKIPADVSLIGFDDMPWSLSLNPPLTSVAQPTYDFGSAAAELLLQRIADKNRDVTKVKLDPELIIRESCAHAR